jgi:hypothetical protein
MTITEIDLTRAATHGHAVRGKLTKEHRAWANAKTRCFNPRHQDLPTTTTSRGITMATNWVHEFQAFFDHIGPAPLSTATSREDS